MDTLTRVTQCKPAATNDYSNSFNQMRNSIPDCEPSHHVINMRMGWTWIWSICTPPISAYDWQLNGERFNAFSIASFNGSFKSIEMAKPNSSSANLSRCFIGQFVSDAALARDYCLIKYRFLIEHKLCYRRRHSWNFSWKLWIAYSWARKPFWTTSTLASYHKSWKIK